MTPSFEQAAEQPLDRKKYDSMLQETIDQLSLIIDRKYEDFDQLEKIWNKADSCSDTSRKSAMQ